MKSCFLFISWILPLVLYLKSHCCTQGHLGFLLCYLIGVLQFVCYIISTQIYIFELIFVKCVWPVSRILFLRMEEGAWGCCLVVSSLKRPSLLHYIAIAPLSKISWPYIYLVPFMDSVLFRSSICLFFHQNYTIFNIV